MQLARIARSLVFACLFICGLLCLTGVAFADAGESSARGDASGTTIGGAALVLSALNGVYTTFLKQRMVDREKLAVVERGLTSLREQLKAVPKTADLTEVIGLQREQKATLSSIEEQIERLGRRFEKYEEHMLEARR